MSYSNYELLINPLMVRFYAEIRTDFADKGKL